MLGWRLLAGITAAALLTGGCGSDMESEVPSTDADVTAPDAGTATPDAGVLTPDAGVTGSDARSASPDALPADAGSLPDAGADAAAVRLIGRVDRTDPAGPRFTWSGTTILARFTGTTIGVRLRDGGNRFDVTLDGVPLPTLAPIQSRDTYPLATGLASGPHELTIYRRTEALLGETQFLGLILDPAGTLLPLPPPATRRLEFVGDSITCGYGIEGPDQHCPFTADTENHALAFGALATKALSAEAITVAFSGRGMFRNLDNMNETLPQLYDRALVGRPGGWDFASWIPDAVVINLGTNDFGLGVPGQGYADAYKAFLQRVRGHYPRAHILCTLGPMMRADQVARARGYIEPTIEAARAGGDTRISYLEFAPQDGSTGFGCDWHPSQGTNRLMADKLTAELRRLLGW